MNGTVFITGATAGIGQACARRFGEDRWRLILAARRERRLEDLRAELAAHAAGVHVVALDVRNRDQVRDAVRKLPEDFRNVDVLINSAGLGLGQKLAHEGDLDDWEAMLDTNIKGLLYCTRMLLPGMVARNRGHIINIGSVAGNYPYRLGNVYGATKAFVKRFSQNLRADLFGTRVRVTNIEPGLVKTEFSLVRFKGDQERAGQVYEDTEVLTAPDIAEALHWAATRPSHVNVDSMEVMPVSQSWGGFAVNREETD